jgi:hypothetical protein
MYSRARDRPASETSAPRRAAPRHGESLEKLVIRRKTARPRAARGSSLTLGKIREFMNAKLSRSSRLVREWEFTNGAGLYRLSYDGRGMGYESVVIDGLVVQKKRSWLWYVPRFDFAIDSLPGVIEVRVGPWFSIRAIRLKISGQVLFEEGSQAWPIPKNLE